MLSPCSVFWFRRDLRLKDNRGLYHALSGNLPVLCLFIFDTFILDSLKDKKDARLQFIHTALNNIKNQLISYNSDFLIFHSSVLKAWQAVTAKYLVHRVHCNEDYEPYAIKRDGIVRSFLNQKNISFFSYKDQCIFDKQDILKQDNTPYTVYTPYKNKWLASLNSAEQKKEHLTPLPLSLNASLSNNYMRIKGLTFPSLEDLNFITASISKTDFNPEVILDDIASDIKQYETKRDIPALDATSKLGVHLRFGTISVRACVNFAFKFSKAWLEQLIWREFFMQILYHYPRVVNSPFKQKYKNLTWINDSTQFECWCEGKTGYALVDAGMRQLNQTGFMHNRVRMLTASFLVKYLLIDWRWGEAYFAQKLLDYDLSANNGNWQWVAGTGCDAAPYFRIFNPDTQLKKFDPNFKYVKKWVPEFGSDKYPAKMIEHKYAYQRALDVYRRL